MRQIKDEIRILGVDDGPFEPRKPGKAILIGVVYRGGSIFDGALKAEILVDGMDATDVLIDKINNSKYKGQLRVLMLHGITMGGFNIVDIKRLNDETGLPVIVVCRRKPDLEEIEKALEKFDDFRDRWACVKNAGKIFELKMENNKKIYYQFIGLGKDEAEKIIRLSSIRSLVPEPLRVAHMIASAVINGESGYRA